MAALADRDLVEAGWPGYEIRCDMRRLRVEDCVVALRMQQLLEVLQAKALESKDRRRYLRVIGIDATTPENFRSDRKLRRGRL
jgi:hypothetical protein